MTTGKNEFSLVVRASAGKSRPVQLLPLPQMSVCNVRLSGQILAWNEAPHWGKRKKIGVGQKKKKIGEQSEPRGSLGSFPHPQAIAGLASLADTFPI